LAVVGFVQCAPRTGRDVCAAFALQESETHRNAYFEGHGMRSRAVFPQTLRNAASARSLARKGFPETSGASGNRQA
jgi:hypothetical protein